jgi:predicted lipoprotein with Yx(FWY)xxD motif
MRKHLALPPILIVAVAVAACGSSSTSTSKSSAASAPPSSSAASKSSSGPTSYPTTAAGGAGAASTAKSVVITTKQSKLGTILAVGPKRLTVYLFEGDKGPQSACAGPCAAAWPPVLGKPSATGSAVASDLGTITRSGGATQVTYKGHPLYMFVKDKDDGDTYGEGVNAFGAGWYVLTPAGNKIDKS